MPAGDPLVLGIDQGTSGTKAIAVNLSGTVAETGHAPVRQYHPAPGLVEQSPLEIWDSVCGAVADCLSRAGDRLVIAIGLSTQRESLVAWDRKTGAPLGPVIGWQDRRSSDICTALAGQGLSERIKATTGLPVDPMFSAAKASWLLDEIDPDRRRSARGEIRIGTVDAWLLSRFSAAHVTEIGNASRTQLFDIRARAWDPVLLEAFRVPAAALPHVTSSTGPFPSARDLGPVPDGTPVTGVAGDSHAALFAHAGWRPGHTKVTYGTGSSVMSVTSGRTPPPGLCLTIPWDTGSPTYALEGNIRSAGATVSWLADVLGLSVNEVTDLAGSVASAGVHLVPAFTGLGAPWWDNDTTALIDGLTPSSGRAALARAAIESIAFQVNDVVTACEPAGGAVRKLLADGQATANRILMQLQADTGGCVVQAARGRDHSALGAAYLAGLGHGAWDMETLEGFDRPSDTYTPAEPEASRNQRISAWHDAVRRCRWHPYE